MKVNTVEDNLNNNKESVKVVVLSYAHNVWQ